MKNYANIGANIEWQKGILKEIGEGSFESAIVRVNANANWLVYILAQKNISFSVTNLGVGVKKITTRIPCPNCKGKGYIK